MRRIGDCDLHLARRAYKFKRKPTGEVLAVDRTKAIHARIPNTHLVLQAVDETKKICARSTSTSWRNAIAAARCVRRSIDRQATADDWTGCAEYRVQRVEGDSIIKALDVKIKIVSTFLNI